jgi:hypothetical protein
MRRSLVRGFILNEMMHTLIGVYSYDCRHSDQKY